MRRILHILAATRRTPAQLSDWLGPGIHFHCAQDVDASLALAVGTRPDAVLIDIEDAEFGDPDLVSMLRRMLGPRVPLIGCLPSGGRPAEQILRAGLHDLWNGEEPARLLHRRLSRLVRVRRFARAVRQAKRERRLARSALVTFLRRLEETLSYPLDAAQAQLLLLHADARRNEPPPVARLDQISCQHQEIRRILGRIRKLSRTLSTDGGPPGKLRDTLESAARKGAREIGRIRLDP